MLAKPLGQRREIGAPTPRKAFVIEHGRVRFGITGRFWRPRGRALEYADHFFCEGWIRKAENRSGTEIKGLLPAEAQAQATIRQHFVAGPRREPQAGVFEEKGAVLPAELINLLPLRIEAIQVDMNDHVHLELQ